MKSKVLLFLLAGLLITGVWLYAETVTWETDPSIAGGQRRGVLIQTPTGETLPVSGTVSTDSPLAVNVLSDDDNMDSPLAVNVLSAPTTAVTGTFWQATQPVSGTFWQATQPVSGTFWQATQPVSGTVTATNTAMLSDTVQVDSCAVNPYSYTEKHYTNVKGIEIYNAGKGVRVYFSTTTGTPSGNQYWLIPSTALGYEKSNLNFTDLYINLQENGGSDTPTVMFNIWK